MNKECNITCWVVRQTASSIQFGGLERLFVHFSKPTFYYRTQKFESIDNPFNDPTEKCGIFEEADWRSNGKTWVPNLSVGNWLGYDNSLSDYIWDKLCEHFNGKPFEEWEDMEKNGIVKREDFCLELDLKLCI